MADSVNAILLGLIILETGILVSIWINDRINKIHKKANLEKSIIAINGSFWLGLAVYFLLVALFAFHYPDSFKEYEIGLVFVGIGASCLGMLLYWTDKIDELDKDKNLNERLERIEGMLKKM